MSAGLLVVSRAGALASQALGRWAVPARADWGGHCGNVVYSYSLHRAGKGIDVLALPCHLQSRRRCSKRRRQCGQQRSTRVSAATIPRRTAGRLGRGGGPGSGGGAPLFSPEPQGLQGGGGQQAQERVVVQPAPGAALEVVEPDLVLELLVQLLAHPAGLDQRRQPLERGIGREVREVVLPLARGPVLADQPRLLAGQVPAARVG